MSVRKLPLIGAVQFKIISERIFACLTSPAMWGKAGVEFITNNGQKMSGEAIPMASKLQMGWEETCASIWVNALASPLLVLT